MPFPDSSNTENHSKLFKLKNFMNRLADCSNAFKLKISYINNNYVRNIWDIFLIKCQDDVNLFNF